MSLDSPRFNSPEFRGGDVPRTPSPQDAPTDETKNTAPADQTPAEQPKQPEAEKADASRFESDKVARILAFYRQAASPRAPGNTPPPETSSADDTPAPEKTIRGEVLQSHTDTPSDKPKPDEKTETNQEDETQEQERSNGDRFLLKLISEALLGQNEEDVETSDSRDKPNDKDAPSYDLRQNVRVIDPDVARLVIAAIRAYDGERDLSPDDIRALIDFFQNTQRSQRALPTGDQPSTEQPKEQQDQANGQDQPAPEDAPEPDEKKDSSDKEDPKDAAKNAEKPDEKEKDEAEDIAPVVVPGMTDDKGVPLKNEAEETPDKPDEDAKPGQETPDKADENATDGTAAPSSDTATEKAAADMPGHQFPEASRAADGTLLPDDKAKQPEHPDESARNAQAHDGAAPQAEAGPHAPRTPEFRIHEPDKANAPDLPEQFRQPGATAHEIESSDPHWLKLAYDTIVRVVGEAPSKLTLNHLSEKIDEKILVKYVPLVTGLSADVLADTLPIALMKEERGEPHGNKFVAQAVAEQRMQAEAPLKAPAQSRYYIVHGSTGQHSLFGREIKDPKDLWQYSADFKADNIIRMIEDTRDRVERRARNEGDMEAASAVHGLYAQVITYIKMRYASTHHLVS